MKPTTRPTGVTGFVEIGNSFRQVTVRARLGVSPGAAWKDTYVALTMGKIPVDPWSCKWRTLRTVRNALAAALHADHRLSQSGPSMFAFDAVALTGRDGQLKAGRSYEFPYFVEHMLNVGGWESFRGETFGDRMADALAMLAQETWLY